MATITDQLQNVLASRNSSRIAVIIEAEPMRGGEAEGALRSLGLDVERVDVRNKAVFDTVVTRDQIQQIANLDPIAVIDHSPTFAPQGAAPGTVPGPIPESRRAENFERVTLGKRLKDLGVREVWSEEGTRGEGVRIGMIDSPIAQNHTALRSSVEDTERNAGSGVHGTWVASALVADPFDVPEGTVHGGAPDASLVAHGALSGGAASVSEIAEGIDYCIQQECDVINLSMGGPHSSVLQSITTEAVEAGIPVISSAGNSGPGYGTVSCPAHHEEPAAIGSIGPGDRPAGFSARGPGWNGTQKPDAVAYGGMTSSQDGIQVVEEAIVGAAPADQSAALVGTSMAAPQAASIVALRKAALSGNGA